jgi:hypothetical protein
MLLKGNILQYKKNSSSLTKNQRYTQIAKGMWTNRTKTWATQSATYTNPNTGSLLRVNSVVLDPSNNAFSRPPNPFLCGSNSIQDGGNLVCNVVVQPCTGEIIKRTISQQICNPTTDSNVPGQIQPLCWNNRTQTWYPRQRYVMPTSGTKWPEGYKGLVSAIKLIGPVLSVGTIACDDQSIPLSWTFQNNECLPITSFNIYQNNVLILNVPASQTSAVIQAGVGTFMFYVTSLSNSIESEKSNIVAVSTLYNYTAENGIMSDGGATITFSINGTITFNCTGINFTVTCVGGGGGGGGGSNDGGGGGGGGGGGQILISSLSSTTSQYLVVVGNGGSGGSTTTSNGLFGTDGEPSSFDVILTAFGGYGGLGGINLNHTTYGPGGAGGNNGDNTGTGGAGGNNTVGASGTGGGGGGGGGYSYGGGNGSTNTTLFGYGSGGGGGGGNSASGGNGGLNAGNGSKSDANGEYGQPSRGGGGGGGKSGNGLQGTSHSGGSGGSGVVIINI